MEYISRTKIDPFVTEMLAENNIATIARTAEMHYTVVRDIVRQSPKRIRISTYSALKHAHRLLVGDSQTDANITDMDITDTEQSMIEHYNQLAQKVRLPHYEELEEHLKQHIRSAYVLMCNELMRAEIIARTEFERKIIALLLQNST